MEDGTMQCWGRNANGQIGDGTTMLTSVPVKVLGLSATVLHITAGDFHTCALLTGGDVSCWGRNDYGQLGTLSQDLCGAVAVHCSRLPVSASISDVAGISAGESHTCALRSNGSVQCWGNNFYGQLGNGTRSHSTSPVDVSGLASGVVAISAGDHHTCALLQAGSVTCWGLNDLGKLGALTGETCGPDDEACSLVPLPVQGLSEISAIDAGGDQTCALTAASGMKCWGANISGQLGGGTAGGFSLQPVDVSELDSGVTSIITAGEDGYGVSCALAGGVMKCWGDNSEAQLGNGEGGTFGEYEAQPVDVLDLKLEPVTPTPSAVPSATPTPVLAEGDANCDGGTDAIDSVLVLQLGAGLIGTLPCDEAADVNEDGSLNSLDAALILQYVAGLIDGLPA
jgi:alpha-tubulin suppressor-like RCC1 family protein